MLDQVSLTAIATVLGAVGSGMANEAGRWAWESAGGLVRRIAGREVTAPTGAGERDAVAREVLAGLQRQPQLAVAWAAFAQAIPGGVPGGSSGGITGTTGGGRLPVGQVPQLRPSTRFFTDRQTALKQLVQEASRSADGRPRVALLHGDEGMGTSTLAVHWGCRDARRFFPDGQLHVDLRGDTPGAALGGATALHRLLGQLGVPAEEIPTTADERIDFFRRTVAELRLLVILDHVRSAAQIRPLITSAPGVFTLIVSRHPLPGLDALRIPVEPLADRDAVRLLTQLVGKQALSAARATLPSVLERCGGSPYALRAAALRLTEPTPSPSGTPDDPVPTAADDTYRLLPPDAARVYRLTALRPWPGFTPATGAWATGLAEADTARLLGELADVELLEHTTDGRYFYRPAVLAHAARTAAHVDGIAGCAQVVTRTLAGYRDLAVGAARAALPNSWRVPSLPAGAAPVVYDRPGTAVAVLSAEVGNLVQAIHAADEFGDHTTVMELAQALWPLQLKAGYHDELRPALQIAVRTADAHRPGTRTAGALHAQLAHTFTELGQWDEAESEARKAADAESAAGHVRGHASTVEFLGLLRLRQWRFADALDCFDASGRLYDGIGPDGEGAADLPRARALLERHRGRALRGLGRRAEAKERLETALGFFRESGEAYNTARALTDLAETCLDGDDSAGALPLIEEAEAALADEQATYQLVHLRRMRQRCGTTAPDVSPGGPGAE
ncbi:tetratricopeptide repeat protein [Streptomyces sp. NPDC058001]|uniref:tetratricopeptide repeat protein n=1 Tax=Streptomyces sp. NPDC058001 TaxID=3346300 RepID=UPI0036DFDBCC